MPLSDEEARMLQQLEQSLAAEDPEFASTLRGSKFLARSRRVAVIGVVGFLAGLGLLFTGAVTATTWVGIAGFVLMLGAAYLFAQAWRKGLAVRDSGETPRRPRGGPRGPKGPKPSGSFVDRMEERWQRRQDGDDR